MFKVEFFHRFNNNISVSLWRLETERNCLTRRLFERNKIDEKIAVFDKPLVLTVHEESDNAEGNGPTWRRLKPGDTILHDVAQHFTDYDHAVGMATKLLHGVGQGGFSYVKSLFSPGAVPPTKHIAHSTLEEWCSQRPEESTGAHLFAVLYKVLPSAAHEFKDRLLTLSEDEFVSRRQPNMMRTLISFVLIGAWRDPCFPALFSWFL